MPWKVQDSSVGDGEKVANRRPITCYLDECLSLENPVLTFDIYLPDSKLVSCSEQIIALWSLDDYRVIEHLGISGAFQHKGLIRDCKFNRSGSFFVTAAEDAKIILWSFDGHQGIHKLSGHLGPIYKVQFSEDDRFLYSSSMDGKIFMWDWEKNQLMYSFLRHTMGVHSFNFSDDLPDKLAAGCDDGSIHIWDLASKREIDTIPANRRVKELDVEIEVGNNHSGAICCIEFSAQSLLLASGSLDGTCKIWNVISYAKQADLIKADTERAKSINLERRINVLEDNFEDFEEILIGETEYPTGYHADLLFTLEHEGPCIALTFSSMGDLIATSSLDCTIRIWNSGNGLLLFQINVPAPVYKLHLDDDYVMTCNCDNRILVFQIKTVLKESDLPPYYLNRLVDMEGAEYHMKKMQKMNLQGHDMSAARALVQSLVSPSPPLQSISPRKIVVQIEELKRHLAHGSLSPTAVYTIIEDLDTKEKANIVRNMEEFKITPMQVLRIISSNRHPTEEILHTLSDKKAAQTLSALIERGTPLGPFLEMKGLRTKSRQETIEDFVLLNPEDITEQIESFPVNYAPDISGRESPMDKNRIVHFSPAETIRILKALEKQEEISSISAPEEDSLSIKPQVAPFFIRQLQNNTGGIAAKRTQYFSNRRPEKKKKETGPFIFETRSLAKYDKVIVSNNLKNPSQNDSVRADVNPERFNDLLTFKNSIFKTKPVQKLYSRFVPPSTFNLAEESSHLKVSAHGLGSRRIIPNLKHGNGHQRHVPGLDVRFDRTLAVQAQSVLYKRGGPAPGGVSKAKKAGGGKNSIKWFRTSQDVSSKPFILRQSNTDNYFQQVIVGKNAMNHFGIDGEYEESNDRNGYYSS